MYLYFFSNCFIISVAENSVTSCRCSTIDQVQRSDEVASLQSQTKNVRLDIDAKNIWRMEVSQIVPFCLVQIWSTYIHVVSLFTPAVVCNYFPFLSMLNPLSKKISVIAHIDPAPAQAYWVFHGPSSKGVVTSELWDSHTLWMRLI